MTNPLAPSLVLPPLVSSAAMRAIVGDRARLQRVLDFEAALVRAEAAVGIVPASAVDPIVAACRAERYDLAGLGEAIAAAGSLVAPLLNMITGEVAKLDAQAASYLNWGADGQDIIDTALVLELRAAIDALTADLNRAIEAFIALAGRQRRTASMARASLRHALPMPFGLKVAGYAAALGRARERLRRLRKDALMLQFGGTAGTLAALGDQGLNVTERLAALLDLPAPEAPSHSQRDRLTEIACALGTLAGTCGKVGRDLALLMQSEIAEVYDPADAAGRASDAATPKGLTPAAAADLAQGIEVDADRMRANVDLTHGLIMAEAIVIALAGKIGPQEARKIVEAATRKAVAEKRSLQNVLGDDARVSAHLSGPTLGRLFDPMSYQGAAQTFIDRLIGSLKSGGKRL